MTKKDFISLADYLKQAAAQGLAFDQYQLEILAGFCKESNPNFKKQRWLDYIAGKCGPSGGKISPSKV